MTFCLLLVGSDITVYNNNTVLYTLAFFSTNDIPVYG